MSKSQRIWIPILFVLLTAGWAMPGMASASGTKVVKRPISFEVVNLNRSLLACPSDGTVYEVKGHLIGPASKVGVGVTRSRSATLYLHGFSIGAAFWDFSAVPRYDYAVAMAGAGHVSVVVDRLGYGASGRPRGDHVCLGAQADVAHQIVEMLRDGDYALADGASLRFGRVALVGHSLGGLIADLEAYSFEDVDALGAMSYAPQVTQLAFEQFYTSREVCDHGGEPAVAGGPGAYAYFARSESEFHASAFNSVDPVVEAAATRLRARDPCGDGASIIPALVLELKSLGQVKVPVLLVCGREDAMTPDFGCVNLKRRYVGSADVTLTFVRNAGHALPLGRAAPALRRRVSGWLTAHGF
jgi:pimeloyl-ACP methyl ester carboxylesterase